MLETRRERVELLKSGIDGKRVEELYVTGNNIRIVNSNLLRVSEDCHTVPILNTGK